MKIDYANTWFYKIASKDLTILDFYIGYSTINFERTYKGIKDDSKLSERPVYKFIREHGGYQEFNHIKIASKVCGDKSEALREQRRYVEEYKPTLNGTVPSRSKTEYYQDNKSKILEHVKEYILQPHVVIHRKEYYIENKAKILEIQREYYIKNKIKISERKKKRRNDKKIKN